MSNRDTTPARCAVIKREAEQCFARVYAKWRSRVGTPQYDHGAANREIAKCYALARAAVLDCGQGVTIYRRDRDR
jgi:hypothetical protein